MNACLTIELTVSQKKKHHRTAKLPRAGTCNELQKLSTALTFRFRLWKEQDCSIPAGYHETNHESHGRGVAVAGHAKKDERIGPGVLIHARIKGPHEWPELPRHHGIIHSSLLGHIVTIQRSPDGPPSRIRPGQPGLCVVRAVRLALATSSV